MPDQVMEGDQCPARGTLSCIISLSTTQRSGNLYGAVSSYEQHLRQEEGIAKKLILTLCAIMISQEVDLFADDFTMVLRGDAEAETTSVLSTKPLQTVHCQRRRALLHCVEPDRFQTTGLTSVDSFSRPAQIGIGRYACTVRSPSHAKFSACVQLIKLPSWDMAPPRFRRLAQFPITSRRTWPTNPTQRASCTTSSRAAEKAHQRYHERSFALFVTVRPFARVRQSYAKTCTSSRNDLMIFFCLWQTCHRRGMFWFRPLLSCFILATFTLRNTPHEHHVMALKKRMGPTAS